MESAQEMVKPEGAVTDFRTAITGHTAADLEGVAYSRAAAQQDLLRHLVGQVRAAAASLPLDFVPTPGHAATTLPGTVVYTSAHISMQEAHCPPQQLPPRSPAWKLLSSWAAAVPSAALTQSASPPTPQHLGGCRRRPSVVCRICFTLPQHRPWSVRVKIIDTIAGAHREAWMHR